MYIPVGTVCTFIYSGEKWEENEIKNCRNVLYTVYDNIYNRMLHIFHRCVEEKDKPIAMGFGMTMGSLCAFIPSPILFGIILGKDANAHTNV